MRRLAAVAWTALLLTACGGGENVSRTPTGVTVTDPEGDVCTVDTPPDGAGFDCPNGERMTEAPEPSGPEPAARPQTINPGETITLHNRGRREAVEVMLHDVSYPAGSEFDQPSKGKVLVELQMKIRNVGKRLVSNVNAYPAWQGDSGQYLDDTGWAYGAFGRYGDPGYQEELSGTIPPKAFVQGFSLYEVPPEPGVLIFKLGPSTMKIPVAPPPTP